MACSAAPLFGHVDLAESGPVFHTDGEDELTYASDMHSLLPPNVATGQ